jgi:hypothetical protein
MKWNVQFNPLLTLMSGQPFDTTAGQDFYGDTLFNGRPGIATDPNKPGVVARLRVTTGDRSRHYSGRPVPSIECHWLLGKAMSGTSDRIRSGKPQHTADRLQGRPFPVVMQTCGS